MLPLRTSRRGWRSPSRSWEAAISCTRRVTPISGFNGDALWWFDEYAVDSSGQAIDVYARPAPHPLVNIRADLLEEGQFATTVRPGLGYLGYPREPGRKLAAGVYRRDFQRGIVLANFSRDSVTLSL